MEERHRPRVVALFAAAGSGEENDGATSGDGIWPLYVGLFLALLTFFIVLVSISQPDQLRSEAVVGSLKTTFGSGPRSDDGLFAAGASALAELGGDLNGLVRIERIEGASRGDQLQLILSASELFTADGAVLREPSKVLIDRVVAAFGAMPAGLRLNMAFTLGIAPGPGSMASSVESAGGDQDGDFREIGIGRCGILARTLVNRGAPPAAIAVGIDQGPRGRAMLSFRITPDPPAPAAAGHP